MLSLGSSMESMSAERGTVFGWRAFFARVVRSRGKPARMRVWHARAPALRLSRPYPFTVGRGPVPRRAIDRGNGFGRRAFFAQIGRSRGTGPRATGPEGFSSRSVRP